jgi:hypothetical protein
MGSNSGAIGLKSVSNVFSSNGYNFVYGQTSNVYANLVTIGTGSGANLSVGSLTDEETVFLNEDLFYSNNSIANTIATGISQGIFGAKKGGSVRSIKLPSHITDRLKNKVRN